MKAYIETLSGIIRVGPKSEKYGDPYDFAIAFACTDNKTAVIKALVSDSKTEFTHSHAMTIIRELKKIGLDSTWERIKRE